VAVAGAEFLLEGLVAHRRLSRSEEHGFKANDSVVSVFSGCRGTAFTFGLRREHWQDHVRNLLRGLDAHESPTFLLDPIVARLFMDIAGLKTKQALIDWAYENACMPAEVYWDYQLVQNYVYPRATFGEEPYATKLKAAPDEEIPMFNHHDIEVVIVGGETNPYWRIMSARLAGQVSIDDWR